MTARDVLDCAIDAFITVLWWWVAWGIVVSLLNNGWGFVLVLITVFAYKVYKAEKKVKSRLLERNCDL